MNMSCSGAGWKVVAASVRGRAHVDMDIPCQDAFAVRCEEDVIAAVVCDGAGSASMSHFGAAAVSDAIVEYLCYGSEGEHTAAKILDIANTAIAEAVDEHGGEPKDFACTVQGVRISGNTVVSLHLGDGLIASGVAGETQAVQHPQRGEYANSTFLVPSPDAVNRIVVQERRLPHITRSFVLMTDGLLPVLYRKLSGEVSQVAEQMAAWLDSGDGEQVAARLEAIIKEKFVERTSDDCTIVLMRREESATEMLPPTCPECARWVTTGEKRFAEIRYKCDGCGKEFRHWKLPFLKGGH